MIPCSDKPFPIELDKGPENVSFRFLLFAAQLRELISSLVKDYRGRIVPHIDDPAWRLIHADINFDVPTSVYHYMANEGGLEITKANDVILRIYRKRLSDGLRYIRHEEGTHQFKSAPLTDSIGQTIIEAAHNARQQLLDL